MASPWAALRPRSRGPRPRLRHADDGGDSEKDVFLKTTRKVKKFKLLNHYYSPQLKRRRVYMPDIDPREIYILE